ncbi:MAG TPA: 6-pyruvoyl-tetrahydropterin synthase-related protein [Vicinamibacteria bacterium]|nr:6-pyruvoyl-tetrahydropterin synthase-related protein [Vicinamibacteria bacterium]
MKERGWTAIACVTFALLAVWLTWPLFPRMTTGLSHGADALLNSWTLGWSFHILTADPLSLFDANIFAPRPDTLAYSEHLFGVTLLAAPVYLMTGNLVLAYNFAMLSSFVLSGLGMYLLARDLAGDKWAALIAGTIYLAAPYRFGHLLQLQLLTLQWFPFVFWSLNRFLRDGGRLQLAGVVVFTTLQILSCNYYAVYLAFALAVLAIVLLIAGRQLLSRRKIVSLTLGAATVAALVAPFIPPYVRNRERGFYRRYEDVVHFSARPADYLTPSSFNKWRNAQPRSEKALFPGFGAMVLAGTGLLFGRRRDPMWIFFFVLSLLGFVLSLGPEIPIFGETLYLPYRFFYRHVPGFGGLRVPARLAVLTLVGLSALSAWGAAGLLSKARRYRPIVAVALLGILIFEYRTYPLDRVFPEAPRIPEVHRWLSTAPSKGAVLVLPIHEGEDIVHESLTMYYSTAHYRPLVNGYSGWWPNDYWELVGRLRHFPTARILDFLLDRAPVRYLVIHYDRIPQPRRRQLQAGMERYHERMPVVFRVGQDVVHEIR